MLSTKLSRAVKTLPSEKFFADNFTVSVSWPGDNIYGSDSADAAKSMDAAIAPAIAMRLPWAAVMGNHDQEGTLSREGVMRHLVGMKNTLSRFNPQGVDRWLREL